MRTKPKTGWRSPALLALCLAVLGAAPAAALDVDDVQNLLRNRVQESVIISLVRQEPNLALTPEQANTLRSLGASETLIAAIPPAATTTQSYGYDSAGNLVYYDSATGQVVSTIPQAAPPGVSYYTPSTPVIIDSSPIVVYEAPPVVTYPGYVYRSRGPSWGFSIGFGSGDRWRGRRHHYHGGHRPPPPWGRPGGPPPPPPPGR